MTTSPAIAWVDHHLLLNAMSVLRNRVAMGVGDSVELLDAISGYLSSGLYIEKRDSVAQVSWLLDWIECMAPVRNSVDPERRTVFVTVAPGGDDERVAHLGYAANAAQAMFSALQSSAAGEHWQTQLRLVGGRVHFLVRGASGALQSRWQLLARTLPTDAVRLEAGEPGDTLACSAQLPRTA